MFISTLIMAFAHVIIPEDYYSQTSDIDKYFATPGTRFTGIYLNYHFSRLFERLFGTRKFASFVLTSFMFCMIFNRVIMIMMTHVMPHVHLMEKPAAFFLTMPMAVLYAIEIPSTFKFTILLGMIKCGNTLFVYLALLHLAMSKPYETIITTIVSIFAGCSAWIIVEVLQIRIPTSVCLFFEKTMIGKTMIGWFFNNNNNNNSSNRNSNNRMSEIRNGKFRKPAVFKFGIVRSGVQAELRRRAGADRRGDNFFVVDESAVDTLVLMGFERSRVVQALNVTDNNIEAAMNILLNDN
jgi:hypothetical protein